MQKHHMVETLSYYGVCHVFVISSNGLLQTNKREQKVASIVLTFLLNVY